MVKIIFLGIAALFALSISWRQLKDFSSHGFYRFFAFELIIILLYINIDYWIDDPFAIAQIISWILLIISLYLVVSGLYLLHEIGKPNSNIESKTDLGFEKTTTLVTQGIFKYIRHPMYASLLFLTWGAFLKRPEMLAFIIVVLIAVFLFLTAKVEERENIEKFGDEYIDYIKKSNMFVPHII